MVERCILGDKKINAVEQIFQTQERADTFVKGIFVGDHWLTGGGAPNCDGLGLSLQILRSHKGSSERLRVLHIAQMQRLDLRPERIGAGIVRDDVVGQLQAHGSR